MSCKMICEWQFTVTALKQCMLGARFALEENSLVHLLPIESQIKETAVMIGALGYWQGGEILSITD